MNLTFNKERIIRAVNDSCKKHGVICESRCADTTDSLYFRIKLRHDDTDCHVSFRISDHKKKSFVPHFKVLLVTKNMTMKHIERFVENRIDTLKHLSILEQLEMLNKKEVYSNARVSR